MLDKLVSQLLAGDLLTALAENYPKLGWIFALLLIVFLVVVILILIGSNIPALQKLFASFLVPISNYAQFKFLQRTAIKNDIEGKVNTTVNRISGELFKEKIKPLKIEWTRNSSVESFLEEGKVLVRVRPLKNQDDNLINVALPFFEAVLLPKARLLLREPHRKAIVYFAIKEVLAEEEILINRFYERYYLPACNKYKRMIEYFEKIEIIHSSGMFFGVAVAALEHAADKLRFSETDFSGDFVAVLNHLEKFIKSRGNRGNKSETVWNFQGGAISYGLLLVARPDMAKRERIKPYVKRAKEKLGSFEVLFVVFSGKEKRFGNSVASAIESRLDVELLEEMKTKYDYRGKENGVVRIYLKNGTKGS